MKIRFYYTIFFAVCTSFAACKKDNYAAPQSKLSGRLMYKGDSIGAEQSQVSYELYQYCFGEVGGINSTFGQDGTYSALLFDGAYKLTIPNGQGPFKWNQATPETPDSLSITLKGSQTPDLKVMPYYMIRNPKLTAAAGMVTDSFKIKKVVTDATAKDIEKVRLYLNKTQFVSGGEIVNKLPCMVPPLCIPITLALVLPSWVSLQQKIMFLPALV